MDALRTVFSGFELTVDRGTVFKSMNIKPIDESFEEMKQIYDDLQEEAASIIKPGIVFVLKDNEYSDINPIINECQYVILAYYTIGNYLEEKVAEYTSLGQLKKADILRNIGGSCFAKTGIMTDNVIKQVLYTQLFGLTKRLVPGEDIDSSYQQIILSETGASVLFGDVNDISTNNNNCNRTFIYGCDPSLKVPTVVQDCRTCLRRDCEYCEAL